MTRTRDNCFCRLIVFVISDLREAVAWCLYRHRTDTRYLATTTAPVGSWLDYSRQTSHDQTAKRRPFTGGFAELIAGYDTCRGGLPNLVYPASD